MKRKALITGITGQDGSYLAEYLLELGYEVHGMVRRVAIEDPSHRLWRLKGFMNDIRLHAASLESYPSVFRAMTTVRPDEVYHLAAQSFVSYSFEDEFSTLNTNINGTHYMLAAVRDAAPQARFYFAGSSEMFGECGTSPQSESTPFHPRSAYGISKVAGFHLTRNYREAYRLFGCSGILFNHESPRRGFEFVTRKITSHAARIKLGLAKQLKLGNLDARRDWGHARHYIRAMHLIMQQDKPDEFVIASGQTHTVREFVETAFNHVGLDYRQHVVLDEQLFRPAEISQLQGNSAKAKTILKWSYDIPFQSLVHEMVDADLQYFQSQQA